MRFAKTCLAVGVIVYSSAASVNNAIALRYRPRSLISWVAPQVRLTARCHQ